MKGYDSVFDYLLAEQEVDRAMFDRQIDLIMREFAPVAQRYLKHVAKVNGLEKMTFADWKLDLDSAQTACPAHEDIRVHAIWIRRITSGILPLLAAKSTQRSSW